MSSSVTASLTGEGDSVDAAGAPQLFVLMAAGSLRGASRHVIADVDLIAVGRGARAATRRSSGGLRRLELTVPDRALSSQHCRLIRVRGAWIVEDVDSKNGTLLNGAPVRRGALRDGDLLEVGQTFLLFREADEPIAGAPDLEVAGLDPPAPALATFSGELARAFDALAAIATSRLPVVILGDTGTGKEGVARAVHNLSERKGAFVAVNCGALPPQLIEAQLFGWRKGAFSGAVDDGVGHVRSSDKGTLFLDEIAELPASAQATLLRVLQENEVVPVGASHPVAVDLRVIVATHQDLQGRVAASTFRRDLWARLAGFTFELPALAERRCDIALIAGSILERLRALPSLTMAAPAARALLSYAWPLNVRELSLALEAAIALAPHGVIESAHLPPALRTAAPAVASPPSAPSAEDAGVRDELIAMLTRHGGNVSAVARAMGKGRMQIHRWLRRFAIDIDSFR